MCSKRELGCSEIKLGYGRTELECVVRCESVAMAQLMPSETELRCGESDSSFGEVASVEGSIGMWLS